MSEYEFKQEVLGEWQPPSEEEQALHDAAREYHRRCDAHDVALCGNPEGRPTESWHLSAINRNARSVLRELADRLRIEQSVMHKAIVDYGKHFR